MAKILIFVEFNFQPSGPSTHPPITCSSESEVDESEEENSNNSPCSNEQTPMLR